MVGERPAVLMTEEMAPRPAAYSASLLSLSRLEVSTVCATASRSVDVYIVHLHQKLSSADGFEIKTVYGMGYKAVLK